MQVINAARSPPTGCLREKFGMSAFDTRVGLPSAGHSGPPIGPPITRRRRESVRPPPPPKLVDGGAMMAGSEGPGHFPAGSRSRGWNTGLVGWTGRHGQRWSTAARWMLLAAVLAGLLGMHILTDEHGTSRHSMLPMANIAAHDVKGGLNDASVDAVPIGKTGAMSVSTPVGVDVQAMPATPVPDVEHGAMAGCILFLVVVGGAALLLALLRRLHGAGSPGISRLARAAVFDMRRRGPPGRWPRLALCVIRV